MWSVHSRCRLARGNSKRQSLYEQKDASTTCARFPLDPHDRCTTEMYCLKCIDALYFQHEEKIMKVEWDESKNRLNKKKHGVSFQDAVQALSDPDAIEYFDESHSTKDEDRFICIGATTRFVLLMVVFTDRKGTTRIISARHADSQERKLYAKRLREKNS